VKPSGVIFIPHGNEAAFLAPLDINVIPGIGKKTEEFLFDKGFRKVSDLQAKSEQELTTLLGSYGSWISNAAAGRGSDVIGEEWNAKSISRDETFAKDISDRKTLEKIIFQLTEGVCRQLRSYGWKAHTITLKLRYSDFKTISRAKSVTPTNDDTVVSRVARELLQSSYTGKLPVRLIGVRLSNFDEENQLQLFLSTSDSKKQNILKVVDNLRNKFGDEVIHVGGD
jgi:DNA polymerase-4